MRTTLEKRWRLKPEPDEALVRELVQDRCPLLAARLLVQRGITDPDTASAFFRPTLDGLHDPFLMTGMQQAVERIERAIGAKEHIMVYGDYDVDGTTAVALVHSFLERYYAKVMFYIPDRYAEGYGVSTQGIDYAESEGVSLIIALDCGIKALDKVAYAKERGIDFIICDHHRPGAQLPDAVAVLDPKRDDCPYPYKELSGCGIGFKLVQALAQRNNIPFTKLEPLLDLVAVSTACDIVPVNGENRILAKAGLDRLNTNPRPGLRGIMDMAGVKRRLGVSDLVFSIGPRINAAGRVEHGRQAVELLLAHDARLAASIGARVDGNNVQRQELDKDITCEALEQIATDPALHDSWSTVVFSPGWHKGVIGIVASRLIERHYRPTVVLAESNGKAVGSARSVKGFDVYVAIEACSDLLEQFGGHMYAAGLTMPLENVALFRSRFDEVVRATLDPALRVPEEEVDLELSLDRIGSSFVRNVQRMAPFGPGNMNPVLLTRGVVDTGNARIVGQDHLKMSLRMAGAQGPIFDAIGFRLGSHFERVKSGEPFSVIYTLEENEWNGRRTLQLNIKDLKSEVKDVLANEPDPRSVIATA